MGARDFRPCGSAMPMRDGIEAGVKRAMKRFLSGAGASALILGSAAAYADQPHPWQMRFQEAATPIMQKIAWFEVYTLWFIIPITLLVLALLIYCIVKFRADVNSDPVEDQPQHCH